MLKISLDVLNELINSHRNGNMIKMRIRAMNSARTAL